MSEHHASVEVNAPVHRVYALFTHFNDFPKFMSFVKEVTYYDEQHSHWVAQVAGKHEWDAVNEGWIQDRQIGWRSISGLENSGRVTFQELGPNRTMVNVFLYYKPPLGKLGAIADTLSVDEKFETALRRDLEHFSHMVEQIPPGTEDPMLSRYLFNDESAVGTGKATPRQKESMAQDSMMSRQALQERERILEQQTSAEQAAQRERQAQREREEEQQRWATQEQRNALEHQAIRDHQARAEQEAMRTRETLSDERRRVDPDLASVQETLGGRNPSMPDRALGDRDARSERYPGYAHDPMMARRLPPGTERQGRDVVNPDVHQSEEESPWSNSIEGRLNERDEE